MNLGLISVRYAKALLEFSEKEHVSENIYREALSFVRIVHSVGNFRQYMENPVLPLGEKEKLILSATDKNPSDAYRKFVKLVLQNGRESQVIEIMLKFIELYRKKQQIHFGKLITATESDKKTKTQIANFMAKKLGGTFELENMVNPELLGGFIFEIDDLRLNASLSHQLSRIKKEFVEKNRNYR